MGVDPGNISTLNNCPSAPHSALWLLQPLHAVEALEPHLY